MSEFELGDLQSFELIVFFAEESLEKSLTSEDMKSLGIKR